MKWNATGSRKNTTGVDLRVWTEHSVLPFHSQEVTWNLMTCLINNCKHLIANISSELVPEWLSHLINSCVKYDELGEVEYKKKTNLMLVNTSQLTSLRLFIFTAGGEITWFKTSGKKLQWRKADGGEINPCRKLLCNLKKKKKVLIVFVRIKKRKTLHVY